MTEQSTGCNAKDETKVNVKDMSCHDQDLRYEIVYCQTLYKLLSCTLECLFWVSVKLCHTNEMSQKSTISIAGSLLQPIKGDVVMDRINDACGTTDGKDPELKSIIDKGLLDHFNEIHPKGFTVG